MVRQRAHPADKMRPPAMGVESSTRPQATLRRLDWRFLLPYPPGGKFRHLLLAGGPRGLAARVVEAQVADQAGEVAPSSPPADALIVLHDSPHPWPQLVSKLADGGVLYWEVARSPANLLAMTPSKIRAQLTAAGLTLAGIYWVAPDFDQARRYIPLDAEGAVAWYFSSLFVAGNARYAAARMLLRSLVGKHDQRLAWMVPALGIVATRGPVATQLPSVLAHPDLRPHLPSDVVRPLLLTSGQDDASRVILLPFAPDAAQPPAVVIKLATQPAFNAETELEQSVQREVRDLVDGTLRQSVPEPRGVYYHHDLAVGVESFAPGHTLWVSNGGWGVPRRTKYAELEMGAAWLARFHAQTERTRRAWDADAMARWVETPLQAYARLRTMTAAETRLFTLMHAHAARMEGVAFPLVWQHHDFAPWNLYRAGKKLTVIDWEGNRAWEQMRAGPSLCDLLYFVTYWHSLVQRLDSPETETAALRPLWIEGTARSRAGAAARRAVVGYVEAMQLDWRWLPLLLVYTWVERVVYSHQRSAKLWGDGTHSPAGDKFAAYVAQLALHADDLFATDHPGFWQSEYARRHAQGGEA